MAQDPNQSMTEEEYIDVIFKWLKIQSEVRYTQNRSKLSVDEKNQLIEKSRISALSLSDATRIYGQTNLKNTKKLLHKFTDLFKRSKRLNYIYAHLKDPLKLDDADKLADGLKNCYYVFEDDSKNEDLTNTQKDKIDSDIFSQLKKY